MSVPKTENCRSNSCIYDRATAQGEFASKILNFVLYYAIVPESISMILTLSTLDIDFEV